MYKLVVIEFGQAENQTLDSNSLFIRFSGYRFKENIERIKKFWTRKYIVKTKEWEVPFSCWDEIKQLYADEQIQYLNEPPKAKLTTDSDVTNGIDYNGFNLYDYQVEGVRFGLNHHNFLLLDEQGLGKTLQIISLARYKKKHQGLKHCLIICGINSLKWNWVKEVAKFCSDERAIVLGSRKTKKGTNATLSKEETKLQIDNCPEEFFWIINIEKIRLSASEIKDKSGIVHHLNKQIEQGNLGMIVVDEIHKCKNTESSQGKGLLAFDKKADRVGMSGTILVNNPYDLYCPMTFVGLINYNKWLFEKHFVLKDIYGNVIGYQNMEELHRILYKSSIRRTKDLLTLPDKIYKQEWLVMNSEEEKVFYSVTGEIFNPAYIDKIEPPTTLEAVLIRLRQVSVAPELVTTKRVKSTKFERLNDILEEAKFNQQKVLVFCPFTEALKLGLEYCSEYHPKLAIGGMGSRLQEVIDEHENTDGFSVLFAQEATLGAGFTLTNTSICVFLSPPWSRASYDQCCDRIHRIGQKHTVQIIDLLMTDTYDEIIYRKLHGKGAMSDVVVDGKDVEEYAKLFESMGIKFTNEEIPQLKALVDKW